jgi:hypothetical protein
LSIRGYTDVGKVFIGAQAPVELKRQLVERAYMNRESVSDAIRNAVRDYVRLPADRIGS